MAQEISNLVKKYNVTWQQTMLRIYDPKETVEFYEKNFGMINIHTYHFNEYNFSLYFLITPPYDEEERKKLPEPNTKESEKYLWNLNTVCLELTYNHNSQEKLSNGNNENDRGFGHIAFNCNDVIEQCDNLFKKNVKFHKLPHETKMKTIGFALDPNNYWIEIVKRSNQVKWKNYKNITNFSQTMIRVKNPEKSLYFYIHILGMKLIHVKHCSDFSLYFLKSNYACAENNKEMIEDQSNKNTNEIYDFNSLKNSYQTDEDYENFKQSWEPVLELTHNHGTEDDDNFSYHNGNTEPRGFGHIGFLVNDLENYCKELETLNVTFKKKVTEGLMKNIAFIYDPDNYVIELIQRDTSFIAK
ncbi:lactoylglutathione lyase [Plasmodium falciparum Santa Lucia]|uniref:Lactoylglutathione lyase n=15 Tax=Plasmodium falciparum TaxID=5833 RepID=Q8IIM5_PLAF7|nr:glyoxalase I [Plasmodium falciparum 3D7]AAP96758.1 glyoxalase I [Plasmodium falciparum]ETW15561.1 lactoylglutathione lyase [Plasmodium falciparum Vietnam Oak-Knoll (FVO)]ETW30465.1 lactoylglutathione lyase [Plasmodium falciparum FCH/4]ETW36043.1 lactoylglutathione lyase [Plasmodium falciparum Tanzania (2000708)]ETW41893.1 lactoylglutathione lyase [Plasmodium falciparum NF135/5.C10]ETW48671.1 lactoylglutathione lyase [Plasmodium falciparum MaliPS096_E11]ETW52763.1 lactoylglutathione lyase |eukprot:XP_001347816.1 glyoxalase I [Plasmodium falciparum 3D7]